MTSQNLPSAEEVIASLRRCGSYHEGLTLNPMTLGYYSDNGKLREIAFEPSIVRDVKMFYSDDRRVSGGLGERASRMVLPDEALLALLGQYYRSTRPVIGFSGFASRGHECGYEDDAIALIYQWLAEHCRPSLVVDGGTGAGVLGLSAVYAAKYQISTLGYTPLNGLRAISPRTYVAVDGPNYRERERLVGGTPSILMVVGGGDGALREAQACLELGGVVLLVSFNPLKGDHLLINKWSTVPEFRSLHGDRFFVCTQREELTGMLAELFPAGTGLYSREEVERRLSFVKSELSRLSSL